MACNADTLSIKGGNFDKISRNRKQYTNKKSALPKQWRTILKEFANIE